MVDDGVREVHGVANFEGEILVEVFEENRRVKIKTGMSWVTLPPIQARHLASKINRLARRIENREPKLARNEEAK